MSSHHPLQESPERPPRALVTCCATARVGFLSVRLRKGPFTSFRAFSPKLSSHKTSGIQGFGNMMHQSQSTGTTNPTKTGDRRPADFRSSQRTPTKAIEVRKAGLAMERLTGLVLPSENLPKRRVTIPIRRLPPVETARPKCSKNIFDTTRLDNPQPMRHLGHTIHTGLPDARILGGLAWDWLLRCYGRQTATSETLSHSQSVGVVLTSDVN